MFASQVPIFISVLFLLAILVPILLIAKLVKTTSYKKRSSFVILFYLSYLSCVTIACFMGVFNVQALPPRIILVTTVPLLLFYLFIVYNSTFYKTILKESTLSQLVAVHIFRLIGVFFLILLWQQQLPPVFAIIAGTGDILTAISSIYVAKAIRSQKKYAKKITFLWNSFGLIDILITSATAVILTKISIDTGNLGVDILTQFPYCFIPSFAPATIIFIHLSIYLKMYHKKFQ
ncbi:hypothetical protein HN014_14305 [Aquimarina sp. TRL1]|uniref:hypothetical protein n=1 Tax=Aquimarina sp. (strain TRL1) TaxID=2736252 RepID=UPI00158C9F70|nr:hypothetical protein [Aquimarina sp. TRL1]QKX06027.1 hypothetical protein HN014_14305 [Aquimarina sp. TRL1]